MAFLEIGGVTIPVEYPGAVADNTETVGDFGRAFSGNPMSSTRAIKNVWRVNTQWMSPAVYDAVRAAVTAAPPLAAVGDLPGGDEYGVEVFVKILGSDTDSIEEGIVRRLTLELHEV